MSDSTVRTLQPVLLLLLLSPSSCTEQVCQVHAVCCVIRTLPPPAVVVGCVYRQVLLRGCRRTVCNHVHKVWWYVTCVTGHMAQLWQAGWHMLPQLCRTFLSLTICSNMVMLAVLTTPVQWRPAQPACTGLWTKGFALGCCIASHSVPTPSAGSSSSAEAGLCSLVAGRRRVATSQRGRAAGVQWVGLYSIQNTCVVHGCIRSSLRQILLSM